MFGFNKSDDIFDQRRKRQELWVQIRRIVDTNTPNWRESDDSPRGENRYNRTVPLVVVPLDNDEPCMDNALFAVTKDLSDNGASVLVGREHDLGRVLCGFWVDGPLFLLGEVRRTSPFGGGFWQVGVELFEVVHVDEPALIQVAEQLVPMVLHETR